MEERGVTQRDHVLALLRAAGPSGVHSFELLQAGLPRAAARIVELRQAGHVIVSKPERLHGGARGCRYRLLPAVADVRVAPAACPVSDTPLSPPEPLLDRQYGDAA